MLKGGTKGFEVVLRRELEVLAIVMWGGGGGGAKSFHPLKEGTLSWEVAKSFGPAIFPFCSPPSSP